MPLHEKEGFCRKLLISFTIFNKNDEKYEKSGDFCPEHFISFSVGCLFDRYDEVKCSMTEEKQLQIVHKSPK